MKYIVSTMANDVAYTIYNKNAEMPVIQRSITVKGGANIANKFGFGHASKGMDGSALWTPSGMVTAVSDEDYALLLEHSVFKRHLEQGYVIDQSHDVRQNLRALDKVTRTMAEDGRAPLNKGNLKARIGSVVKASTSLDGDNQRI